MWVDIPKKYWWSFGNFRMMWSPGTMCLCSDACLGWKQNAIWRLPDKQATQCTHTHTHKILSSCIALLTHTKPQHTTLDIPDRLNTIKNPQVSLLVCVMFCSACWGFRCPRHLSNKTFGKWCQYAQLLLLQTGVGSRGLCEWTMLLRRCLQGWGFDHGCWNPCCFS